MEDEGTKGWEGRMCEVISDAERVRAAIELSKIFVDRCSEIEQIEWRVNFSIWTALLALGYLWINNGDELNGFLLKDYILWISGIVICFGHVICRVWLYNQHHEMGDLRNQCQRMAADIALLEISFPERASVTNESAWRVRARRVIRRWRWAAWEVGVTAVLCIAVGTLVSSIGPKSPQADLSSAPGSPRSISR